MNQPDPDTTRYRVTEALLIAHDGESVWKLTFTPESVKPGVSGRKGGRFTVELPTSLIDNMFFDVSYSPEEITALAEGTWDG